MLIFWNFAGVPFLYSMQAQYLVNVRPTFEYPPVVAVIMVAVLLCAYYVFDTVNGQKNRFRMMRDGAPDYIIRRKTFPAFKYGLIENPRTLKSERGELFIDGWYQYARKAHYSADIVMASIWCLVCGFEHFAVPYFYILFFVPMLLHRLIRDEERGQEKYGELWDRYLKAVPYRLIPYVW
jgi:delta24(24(1))-sterol reductase